MYRTGKKHSDVMIIKAPGESMLYFADEIHMRRRQSLTSHKDMSAELEQAVQILLRPPHVYYIKELHAAARTDPTYIFNNESTVCTGVQQILHKEGIHWKPDFLKRQWQRVLGIAFRRIEEK